MRILIAIIALITTQALAARYDIVVIYTDDAESVTNAMSFQESLTGKVLTQLDDDGMTASNKARMLKVKIRELVKRWVVNGYHDRRIRLREQEDLEYAEPDFGEQ